MAELDERKKQELLFHDKYRETSINPAHKYYSVADGVQSYVRDWIMRHASGRVFLDYACGIGQYAHMAARAGAELAIGIDISRISIENARKTAADEGLSNTFFVQTDCENTQLPSDSLDCILCCGMLHHLDLRFAIPELKRILKPGGRVLAMEALNYNPAIKLYRLLTPQLRTEWEKHHILSLREVGYIRSHLTVQDIRYWHLAALLATPFRHTSLFNPVLRVGNAIDSVAMRVWPVQLMAWMFTFEMVKSQHEQA